MRRTRRTRERDNEAAIANMGNEIGPWFHARTVPTVPTLINANARLDVQSLNLHLVWSACEMRPFPSSLAGCVGQERSVSHPSPKYCRYHSNGGRLCKATETFVLASQASPNLPSVLSPKCTQYEVETVPASPTASTLLRARAVKHSTVQRLGSGSGSGSGSNEA